MVAVIIAIINGNNLLGYSDPINRYYRIQG